MARTAEDAVPMTEDAALMAGTPFRLRTLPHEYVTAQDLQ